MGWFDRAFTLPSGMNSVSDLLGTGGGAPPAMPNLPLPQIPQLSLPALMPNIATPDVKQAGKNFLLAALNRTGRSSTILTSRRKKPDQSATGFDSYSSTTL